MVSAVVSGNVSDPGELNLQYVDIVPIGANSVVLLVNAEPGIVYSLQSKGDLNSINWTAQGPNFSPLQSLTAITNTAAGTPTNRFYRLQVVQ